MFNDTFSPYPYKDYCPYNSSQKLYKEIKRQFAKSPATVAQGDIVYLPLLEIYFLAFRFDFVRRCTCSLICREFPGKN